MAHYTATFPPIASLKPRRSGSTDQRASKRLEWDGFIEFLVRCARGNSGGKKAKDHWESSSDEVIATARRLLGGRTYPVMLTARDLRSLREKHNAHLLDEIVAIQPLVAKNPFTGCGLFETEFRRKGRKRSAQAALVTHELARWPEKDVSWFDEPGPTFVDGSFEGSVDARGDGTFSQNRLGRDNTAAKRVHGIIHRLLATTTKKVVEHIEREVGLRFDYIAPPASGLECRPYGPHRRHASEIQAMNPPELRYLYLWSLPCGRPNEEL